MANGKKIPDDVLQEIDLIKKGAGLKNRATAFQFGAIMQGKIIGENTFRLPKSKKVIKIIDVRYRFRL